VLHYAPCPLTVTRGAGCRIWSLDGGEYLDFLGEYSAGLYGHSNPAIVAAATAALEAGVVLGAPNLHEARFAAELCARFPSLERVRFCNSGSEARVRFCNSGSEADLMALSLARAVTRRDKILAFEEAYHGGFLIFGHGGSPLNVPFPMVMGRYNDVAATRAQIAAHGADLAAVILEPMMGAGGCIPAAPGFLEMLREETARHGILLVFDEVITSRLSSGGLQAVLGVIPDLTTLGKYLGGGSSFGAFGGRAEIMDRFDPARPDCLFHAGTFNNDVLTMAAGHAGLTQVLSPAAVEALNGRGERLRATLQAMFQAAGLAISASGLGSILSIHFRPGPIIRPSDLEGEDARLKQLFHLAMIARGIYLSPRGMMALSLPMGDGEIDALLEATAGFIEDYGPLLPRA
jgi:glutamate-1-semialdehyde 2,1-aminomutase